MTWIVSSSLLGGSLPTTCLPVFLYQTISTRYFPGGGPLLRLDLPLTISAWPTSPLAVPLSGKREMTPPSTGVSSSVTVPSMAAWPPPQPAAAKTSTAKRKPQTPRVTRARSIMGEDASSLREKMARGESPAPRRGFGVLEFRSERQAVVRQLQALENVVHGVHAREVRIGIVQIGGSGFGDEVHRAVRENEVRAARVLAAERQALLVAGVE